MNIYVISINYKIEDSNGNEIYKCDIVDSDAKIK